MPRRSPARLGSPNLQTLASPMPGYPALRTWGSVRCQVSREVSYSLKQASSPISSRSRFLRRPQGSLHPSSSSCQSHRVPRLPLLETSSALVLHAHDVDVGMLFK